MIEILKKFTDLIFENSCLICSESSGQNLICKICESNFIIRNENNNFKSFDEINVYSWGLYDGKLRDGILALKTGKKKLANYFAEKLFNFWDSISERNKNYIVHPVPSHKKRIKERGYCQTTLIAKEFSQIAGLDFSENLIKRKKQTKFMNSLANLEERRENVKDAFEIITPINVKDILVIDDILTSGSTLCEITRTIHKNNQNINIIGLTVAAGDRYAIPL